MTDEINHDVIISLNNYHIIRSSIIQANRDKRPIIFNYYLTVSSQHHHHHHRSNTACLKYAIIREQTFPIPHTPSTTSPMATRDATEFVVCGGEGTRERPLYVSRGSHVTVQTVYITSGRGQSKEDVILFVLNYEGESFVFNVVVVVLLLFWRYALNDPK